MINKVALRFSLIFLFICSSSFATKTSIDGEIDKAVLAKSNSSYHLNHANRSQYISDAITAMWATKKQDLDNVFGFLAIVDRTQCQSSFERLKISCLLESAKQNCKSKRKKYRKNCNLYSDIAVINRLVEKSFISSRKKYRITKNYKNYHSQVQTVLVNEYAKVAVEFSFSKLSDCSESANKMSCLSKGLDKFCLDYGDKNNLSWQYCAGAVLWTIGKNPG